MELLKETGQLKQKIITALNDIQLQHKKAFLELKIVIFKLKSSADELLKRMVAVET